MAFKMNRKRNVGLVHEFLVRRLGIQLVDNDADGAARTIELTHRHFAPGSELVRELSLFDTIRSTRGVSEQTARRVLGEVLKAAKKTDLSSLDRKKGALIRELNQTYGQQFFKEHRISDYRLLGAIQIWLDGQRKGNLSESVQAIQLEDGLVKWMTSTPMTESRDLDSQVDDLVCTMAQRRFREKYGESLTQAQRSLLETYVRSMVTEDMAPLRRRLEEDRKVVARGLLAGADLKEVKEDPIMRMRYVDACKKLGSMDFSRPDERLVEEMMLFHRLGEELTSNE